jgi:hypothetical protein
MQGRRRTGNPSTPISCKDDDKPLNMIQYFVELVFVQPSPKSSSAVLGRGLTPPRPHTSHPVDRDRTVWVETINLQSFHSISP